MKSIEITYKEFNAIQPHIVPSDTFDLNIKTNCILMEIHNFNRTMEWLRDIIKELPFSVGKDVISVLDKVFWFSILKETKTITYDELAEHCEEALEKLYKHDKKKYKQENKK
tara:strand:- start:52 stop:387 length:336 start_codon:yes stop_codon:yes gene_type:complete